MNITDLIRKVLDVVDSASITVEPEKIAAPETNDDAELVRMKQIAGLIDDTDGEYGNSPTEKYATIDDVLTSGDDVHKCKNPADIRSDSLSMYPAYQHGVK